MPVGDQERVPAPFFPTRRSTFQLTHFTSLAFGVTENLKLGREEPHPAFMQDLFLGLCLQEAIATLQSQVDPNHCCLCPCVRRLCHSFGSTGASASRCAPRLCALVLRSPPRDCCNLSADDTQEGQDQRDRGSCARRPHPAPRAAVVRGQPGETAAQRGRRRLRRYVYSPVHDVDASPTDTYVALWLRFFSQ